MRLICCDCEKEYDVDLNPEVNFRAIPTLVSIGRNLIGITKCPHCGLEHFLFLIKKEAEV